MVSSQLSDNSHARPALQILGLPGSLRSQSLHTQMLLAGQLLAPQLWCFTLFSDLETLPPFNPDRDVNDVPRAVRQWRAQVAAADVLIISCPEYARGIPGAFKNSLDWLVGGAEIDGKSIALWSPQPRSVCVGPALQLVLPTIGANLCAKAELTLPLLGKNLNADGIVSHVPFRQALLRSVQALLEHNRPSRRKLALGG